MFILLAKAQRRQGFDVSELFYLPQSSQWLSQSSQVLLFGFPSFGGVPEGRGGLAPIATEILFCFVTPSAVEGFFQNKKDCSV